jgi:hypothetical protein
MGVSRRRQVGVLQPGCLVAQHVASRPFANRLHLVETHVVRSILQRQQLVPASTNAEWASAVEERAHNKTAWTRSATLWRAAAGILTAGHGQREDITRS